jgi:hypothetical protein
MVRRCRKLWEELEISGSEAGRLRLKAVDGGIVALADGAGTAKLNGEILPPLTEPRD